MTRVLLFGSSSRRGATGWTDPLPIRSLLATLRPSVVAHGASPSGGADALADSEAEAASIPREPYPVDPALDGPWPAAGMRRNGRMLATFRPQLAAGFVEGKVGQRVGTRGCYLSNGSDDMARRCRAAKVPLVIVREGAVEPAEDPMALMLALYAVTREEALVPAGKALRAWTRGEVAAEEVALALRCARETSRAAAWLGAVEAAVRAG